VLLKPKYKDNVTCLFLYGWETESLAIRKECVRSRMIFLKVLRRIFCPKGDELTEGWRKLYELHNLYSSPNIVKMIISVRIRSMGCVQCLRIMGKACKILVRKLRRRRLEKSVKT
jgi:hypothetical protein